jgi:glutamine amidotransferase
MQLLADLGHEGGEVPGLGIIPGEVVRLTPSDRSTRIPHVGWNEVYGRDKSPLLDNIPDGSDFYFVHSYYLKAKDPKNVLATTPYCGSFVSAVRKDNVLGVQFHPEKSGRMGFQLLKNFLRIQ